MLPIGDDDAARRTVPLVTYALIALNVLFFFVEQSGGEIRKQPVPEGVSCEIELCYHLEILPKNHQKS